MSEAICYRCGGKATCREHIPPLCIFPTTEDLGVDFRANLITVPSCDEHNIRKSNDDEFLMACLAGIVGNNVVGYLHTKTKVRRALERRPNNNLIHKVIADHKALFFRTKKGIVFPLLSGKPNMKRLLKCFDQIVFGLYFYEYRRILRGETRTIVNFVQYNDRNTERLRQFIKARFDQESHLYPRRGSNPAVFYYQIVPPDKFGLVLFKLTFYEGTDAFVCVKDDEAKEPFDLSMKFINGGFKTIIAFGGKEYVFNES